MLHGHEAAHAVEAEIGLLFSGRQPPSKTATTPNVSTKYPDDLNPRTNPQAAPTSAANAPSPNLTLPRSLVADQPIARVLHAAGLVASRSEGHRLGELGGAYVGSSTSEAGNMGASLKFTPIWNWKPEHSAKYIQDGLIILRVGKWKVKIVKVVEDEEFDRLGMHAPGWEEWKDAQRVRKAEAEAEAETVTVTETEEKAKV